MATLEIIAKLRNMISPEAAKVKADVDEMAKAVEGADQKTVSFAKSAGEVEAKLDALASSVGDAGTKVETLAQGMDKADTQVGEFAKGVGEADTKLDTLAQGISEADVKAAAFAQRQRMLTTEMNKLSKEVASGKLSVAEAAQKYDAFAKTLVKVETVAPQVTQSLENIDQGAKKGAISWTELNQAVELVKTGYGMIKDVAQQVYDVIGEGAKIQAAQATFENLAASIDTTATALNTQLRQATGGMVSDADLMVAANRFVAMGLANTQQEAGELANIATQLGVAFRGDAVTGMEELALMLANQSIPRLDSFGVSAGQVRSRIKELMEANQGMSRETAFMTAFMEQAEVTMNKIGDASETVAGQLSVAEANAKNFSDAFKATFSEELIANINAVAGGVFETQEKSASFGETLAKIATNVSFLGFIRLAKDEIKTLGDESRNAEGRISGMGGVAEKSMTGVASKTKDSKDAAIEHTAAVKAQREAILANSAAVDGWAASLNTIITLTPQAATASHAHATALYQSSDAYAEFRDKVMQTNSVMTEEEAAFRQSQAAAAAANEQFFAGVNATNQYREAVAAMNTTLGDYFAEAAEGGNELALFTSNLDQLGESTYTVSNLTAEQTADLDRMQTAYEKASQTIRDYELGVKGANMTDEERNKKIEEQQAIMATLSTNMQPLLDAGTTMASNNNALTISTSAVNQELYSMIAAGDGSATSIAAAGLALGIFDEAAAEAYLKTAVLKIELEKLAAAYSAGDISLQTMMTGMQTAVQEVGEMSLSLNDATGSVNLFDQSTVVAATDTESLIAKMGEVPDEINTEIDLETGRAMGAISEYINRLNSIPDRIETNVAVVGAGGDVTRASGGYQNPEGRSSGGRVDAFNAYLVGDAPGGGITPYTELFIPDQPGFIANNESLQRLMKSSEGGAAVSSGNMDIGLLGSSSSYQEATRAAEEAIDQIVSTMGDIPDTISTEMTVDISSGLSQLYDFVGAVDSMRPQLDVSVSTGAGQAVLDDFLGSIPEQAVVEVEVAPTYSPPEDHGGYLNSDPERRNSGGRVDAFNAYLVGDASGGGITPYTELFIPDQPGFIVNNETLRRMMGNGGGADSLAPFVPPTPTFGGGGNSGGTTVQIVNQFNTPVSQDMVSQIAAAQRQAVDQALAERDRRASSMTRMRG